MSKNVIIGIVVVALVAAGVFVYVKKGGTMPANIVTASYSDGASVVEASFDNAKETVTFTQSDVGTVTLPRAVSASGARYANADESIVFWEHQGEVTITKDGEDVYKGFSGTTKPSTGPAAAPVLGTWVWERTVMNNDTTVTPKNASAFTVTFTDDGRVSGTTDCNSFSGSYAQPAGGEITFSQFASTMKYCEGSQEAEFVNAIMNSDRYKVSFDSLTLNIKLDGGDVYFKKQ